MKIGNLIEAAIALHDGSKEFNLNYATRFCAHGQERLSWSASIGSLHHQPDLPARGRVFEAEGDTAEEALGNLIQAQITHLKETSKHRIGDRRTVKALSASNDRDTPKKAGKEKSSSS
ncbi:hypothetical protein [Paracoccus litorisediminis]|uniref:Uncharacterized protein n=1 Tax=Paracoccus litorisediminis TaxID=2006130 RepID=A0A844HPV5_9RHOB|nr:hypothetical protein [Paracoccus litorisediminis]MTH61169.1 hypothetical protein [Paracoccus litorisediminis]